MKHKSLSVLEMVEQAPRCSNKKIYSFLELISLGTSLGSSDDNTMSLVVVLE